MSVIVGRALPDVRDGLKPVHRRVLYSMHREGLQPNRPYRKAARVVGDVMGAFHPHGNDAIYDALVRLAQDFAQRYVLKPLFSFAGGGVNVEPTAADLDAIPDDERSAWCIQEKIEYAPALQAPDGGVKIEIRMMFLRPDDEPKPLLTQNLVRLSRGKMLGVDFNKQFTWVGSSIAVH